MTPLRRLAHFTLTFFCSFALLSAAEIPRAAQPQLAANESGSVWLAFGRGSEILVARSDDAGVTFAAPVRVAALPSLMLGRRRGPRIVAHGERLTVTVVAGELFAFNSKDGGKTWTGPALINDVPHAAREGLDGLAVAHDGRLFVAWLDDRTGPKQLYGAESSDGGTTWSANHLLYRAPGGTICECCHPSVAFNARGDLAVMFRNALEGNRDLWLAVRRAGEPTFSPAEKLGTGTWPLTACPMDGGALFAHEDGIFATAWMRDGAVYFAQPGKPEERIDAGQQPVAVATARGTLLVWQRGAELWSATQPGGNASRCAPAGRFPALAVTRDRVLLAYERGGDVVVAPVGGR